MLLNAIKKRCSALMFLLFCLTSPVEAEDTITAAKIVHIAAEQRTLTQKMLKNYVLSGLGVRSHKADKELAEAISTFDKHHEQLKAAITDPQMLEQLQLMRQTLVTLELQYKQKPDQARLAELYAGNEELLKQGDVLLGSMVSAKLSKGAEMMNQIGQVEYLCQRYSALYAMMAWGMRDEIEPVYHETYRALRDHLTMLQSLPTNTPDITKILKKTAKELERARQTAEGSEAAFVPGLIEHSVVRMVKDADELEAAYLLLADELDGAN